MIITETERLVLRPFCRKDLEDLYAYLSDPVTLAYEPYPPMTRKETEKELESRMGSDEMIAVVLKENGRLIGNVYLGKRPWETLEIGYVFNREYWGRGYAGESCRALIGQAFEQGIHRIYAECDPENEKSWRLMERLGFAREGHYKQNVYFLKDEEGRPIWKDTYVYSLLNT